MADWRILDHVPDEGAVHDDFGVPMIFVRGGLRVRVDGVILPHCVGYSIPGGWAAAYETDDDGRVRLDPQTDRLTVYRRQGVITVERLNRD